MIGIELFSGAGGLSLGAANAGIHVKYAVEVAAAPAKTFRLNHPSTELLEEDVRCVKGCDLKPQSGPSIVFGGPPCQGFSTSNQKTRNKENTNNWLFEEFLRIVSEVDPDAVLFENVYGITHTEKGYFCEQLRKHLGTQGYHVSEIVADSAAMGVPQRRKRYFCAGSKSRKIDLTKFVKARSIVTVSDAMSTAV